MGLIVFGVLISVSFQIIPCVVGRLGSEVRVSVSLQRFDLRMFVCPIMFFAIPSAIPCVQKGHFSVPPVLSCFRENSTMAPLRVFCISPGTGSSKNHFSGHKNLKN